MLRIEKVVGRLPEPLFASTLYFVRVGLGFDIYVTDNEGQVAHKVNVDQDQVLLTKLNELYSSNSPVTEDDTVLSAISKLNNQVQSLAQERKISITGDAAWFVNFDGKSDETARLTLATTGVAPGTYRSITVDAKGRATAGDKVITGLVTATAASGTVNAATNNTNTYLNVVEKIGATPTAAGASTKIVGAGSVTVASDVAGILTITGAQGVTGNAATATKLATPRAINGIPFDGSADITLNLPSSGFGQSWADVSASRASGVTYMNSSNKHIEVMVTARVIQNSGLEITIGGVRVGNSSQAYYDGATVATTFIVPPNTTYKVTVTAGGSYSFQWSELS